MAGMNLAIEIEHKVAEIITQQEINGVQFDVEAALRLIGQIHYDRRAIEERLEQYLLPEITRGRTVERPFTISGHRNRTVEKSYGMGSDNIGGPFCFVSFSNPIVDLGSRQKLIKQLQRYGWRPTEFTAPTKTHPLGSPKITEESFASIEQDIGLDIMRYYVLTHRKGLVQGLLKLVREDNRIEARANPQGTPTGRMRHSGVVNIPKAAKQVILGKECRALFIAREGYQLMGWDASGLELRILAHYLNNEEFTQAILTGDKSNGTDLHTLNQRKLGVSNRDLAKTFIYAFLYGAGDAKLGAILGGTDKDGRIARARFIDGYKGLGGLIESVKRRCRRGYLIGLDGRHLPVRSEHAALNTLIQGGGAVFMKLVGCLIAHEVDKREIGLDRAMKVLDMHDEHQWEVEKRKETVELFREIVVKSSTKADKMLGLRCPNQFEIKLGANWAETH